MTCVPIKDVHKRGDAEKPGQALNCGPAIESSLNQSLTNMLFAEIDADWYQRQPSKKNDRKNQEDYDSDIRIRDMAANLKRQDKQPRKARGCDQSNAGQAQPMTS